MLCKTLTLSATSALFSGFLLAPGSETGNLFTEKTSFQSNENSLQFASGVRCSNCWENASSRWTVTWLWVKFIHSCITIPVHWACNQFLFRFTFHSYQKIMVKPLTALSFQDKLRTIRAMSRKWTKKRTPMSLKILCSQKYCLSKTIFGTSCKYRKPNM